MTNFRKSLEDPQGTCARRVKARLHGSPRLINTVESTKVNRVKARLHGSPRLINTVESTKVNILKGAFTRVPQVAQHG
jgi:hypothetical protein